VTLVFTDIEGSTRLLRRLHDAYARMLAEHHAILDGCFEAESGRRLSTEGDGGYFEFPSPAAAARGMLSAQLSLRSHPWPDNEQVRVRMGVHTGEAAVTEAGTYVGLTVHLAARIAAMGHGGQMLASDQVRAAVAGVDSIEFLDLGLHRITDFPEPIRVHQVYRGQPETYPPLHSAVQTLMPSTIGTFFGRDDEIVELADLVEAHRLVTVLGPGGTGKTRLAIETGRRLRSTGVPVHFVDLTGVSDQTLMASHIAAGLSVAQDPEESPVRQIASVLGEPAGVLVLDNCEHLMPGAARLVMDVLEAHHRARIVATSRIPLGVAGERLVDLDPLSIEADPTAGPSPAVALFVDRASAVAPEFVLDGDTSIAVEQIVRRLDGLPLAIELAASLVRLVPVEELAAIVDERLDLLEGGPGRPDRHRSLAAALRWNVEALDATAAGVFESLGVMTGPFTVDDLAAVGALNPVAAISVASALTDHSLLKRNLASGALMFRMLETIRWYALERLRESGASPAARQRHLAHFRTAARTARADLRGPSAAAALARLWPRRPNLLAALERAIETEELDAAVDIVEGLVDPWTVRAAAREARLTTSRVLAAVSGKDPALELRAIVARLEVWQSQGVGITPERSVAERAHRLALETGDDAAQLRTRIWLMGAGTIPFGDPQELVADLEAMGDERSIAYGMEALGWMLWWQDRREEAAELFGRLRKRSIEVGDQLGILDATSGLLATVQTADEIAAARGMVEEISELVESLSCGWWEGFHLQWEASHSQQMGHLQEAAEWLDRAYRIARERGTMNQVAFVASNQATVAWLRGDVAQTYVKTVEFAEANSQAAEDPLNPFVLEMAAAAAQAWGRYEVAAVLCGAAETWRRPGGLHELGMPMPAWDEERHQAVLAEIHSVLPADEYERHHSAGAVMPPSQALELALSLSPPP
jgi:predicted ATPase/class 3 adenylate cyclase